MDDFTTLITTIFSGVIIVAIASVIVSRKSQAPQAIQAISSGIGNIVAAAVNPVSAAYGYGNGSQTSTSPTGAAGALSEFSSPFGDLSSYIPGGFK